MYICLLYSIIIHYNMIITVLCIGNMVIFSKNKKNVSRFASVEQALCHQ